MTGDDGSGTDGSADEEPSDSMSAINGSTDGVDPAIPLGDEEHVEWRGRPRTTVILPSIAAGLLILVAGIVATFIVDTRLLLASIPIGLAVPIGHYLVVSNTQFLVTNRALYHKRGVLGRAVTQANLETVQNSSYSKGITGSVFGYGTVEFEIAGGEDIAFREIHDPEPVRTLVDRATQNRDGISGDASRASPPSERSTIPGNVETWRSVRDEVRTVRRILSGD